jgi:rhomboid protease GluP
LALLDGYLLWLCYDGNKKGYKIEKFKELPLTYGLIIINVVVFGLMLLPSLEILFYGYGELHGYGVLYLGEWYRLFSSMFLHNGAMHILFNMFSLYMLGQIVERLFSRSAYWVIYILTGIVGGLTFIYFNPNGSAVGASGAVFGIFGALAGFAFVYRKSHTEQFVYFMRQFGVILLLNFLLGVIFESIAMSAHVGGLLFGMVLGMAIAKKPNYLWGYLMVSLALIVTFYDYLWHLYLG